MLGMSVSERRWRETQPKTTTAITTMRIETGRLTVKA